MKKIKLRETSDQASLAMTTFVILVFTMGAVAAPLGLWKMVEILIYLFKHLQLGWRA